MYVIAIHLCMRFHLILYLILGFGTLEALTNRLCGNDLRRHIARIMSS